MFENSTTGDILEYYAVSHRRYGSEYSFMCPFHPDGSYSGSMNVNTGLWICHSCGSKGSLTTFVAREEGISEDEARELILAPSLVLSAVEKILDPEPDSDQGVRIPELKPLSVKGKFFFQKRNFSLRTLRAFNVQESFDTSRLIIPLSNRDGTVAGHIGRAFKDGTFPKYMFTKGLKKKHFLFGHPQALKKSTAFSRRFVIVTEGPLDAMKINQFGFPAVAVMGSVISELQLSLLSSDWDEVIIAADTDSAGREMEFTSAALLEPTFGNRISCVYLPEKDPCDCTPQQFRESLYGRYIPLEAEVDEMLGGYRDMLS